MAIDGESATKTAVLVVAEAAAIRRSCLNFLQLNNFDVEAVVPGDDAVHLVLKKEFGAAVIDVSIPETFEAETICRIREASPDTEIVLLNGHDSMSSPLGELAKTVFELPKPFALEDLRRTLVRALERRALVSRNRELTRQLRVLPHSAQSQPIKAPHPSAARAGEPCCLIGESQVMRRVRSSIEEAAPDDISVLIRGESGTGKNVVAWLIHDRSGRGERGEFLRINCPAIPETLFESELFGHESGAFTGADRQKPGRFELAGGGTVLLDEIAEIPPSLQAKLLQAIEHREFTHLGGTKTVRMNARIVAATNAPLESLIAQGRFRQDLFYRLNEYCIHLPPLRERTEDIPLLVSHFLRSSSSRNGRHDLTISPETMSCLAQHQWPGNVRELESVIKRFVLSGREEDISRALHRRPQALPAQAPALRETEIQTLQAALLKCRWNQRRASKFLGISYSALRRRIAKYDIMNRPCSSY
ncbi:MAG: sigma-54 dependent transcriptional regulator [Candidatus Sumerlaeota bacterium]|nr:sigma-54 dependent transcriptional regulator [Candidatus Sumerlaeota bacterium]